MTREKNERRHGTPLNINESDTLSVDTKRRHELRSQYPRFQWVTYNFGLCSMLRARSVDNINVVTQNVCIY